MLRKRHHHHHEHLNETHRFAAGTKYRLHLNSIAAHFTVSIPQDMTTLEPQNCKRRKSSKLHVHSEAKPLSQHAQSLPLKQSGFWRLHNHTHNPAPKSRTTNSPSSCLASIMHANLEYPKHHNPTAYNSPDSTSCNCRDNTRMASCSHTYYQPTSP